MFLSLGASKPFTFWFVHSFASCQVLTSDDDSSFAKLATSEALELLRRFVELPSDLNPRMLVHLSKLSWAKNQPSE